MSNAECFQRCMHCFLDIEVTPVGSEAAWRSVEDGRVICFKDVPHEILPYVEKGLV